MAPFGLKHHEVEERLMKYWHLPISGVCPSTCEDLFERMFVRLTFAVTSVEPDIGLSAGGGGSAFARKSFDRIMRLKDSGKVILFCSHSMYNWRPLPRAI
jgi:lipopolysaccharide transport system ATP-binding protein